MKKLILSGTFYLMLIGCSNNDEILCNGLYENMMNKASDDYKEHMRQCMLDSWKDIIMGTAEPDEMPDCFEQAEIEFLNTCFEASVFYDNCTGNGA